MTNTNLLELKIKEKGLKKVFIAEQLEISRGTLQKKIENKSFFNQYEIDKLCKVLNITSLKEKESIFFDNM